VDAVINNDDVTNHATDELDRTSIRWDLGMLIQSRRMSCKRRSGYKSGEIHCTHFCGSFGSRLLRFLGDFVRFVELLTAGGATDDELSLASYTINYNQ